MKDIGLAIRFPKKKQPKQVVNIHYSKEQEIGKVAFSTGLLIDKRKMHDLEKLLFFWFDDVKQENVYVLADVHAVKASGQPFIPSEWLDYIPNVYKNPETTWMLISNIKIVNEADLGEYIVYERENIEALTDVLKRPRFPRVFFQHKNINIVTLF